MCPEPNQRTVMRNDGPWWTTLLEPNTDVNQIRNMLVNGQTIESKMRYSCDEFPPATWVEGGDNQFNNADDAAQTRCAAIRCGSGVKAEQDWQATAHNNLQRQLKKLVRRRKQNFGDFSFYKPKDSVALFGFTMNSEPDGIAARVWTYDDPAMTAVTEESQVSQARRSMEEEGEDTANSMSHDHWGLSFERLAELIKSGQGSEFVVPANDSESVASWSMGDLTGTTVPMSFMGKTRWEDDDGDDDDGDAEDDFEDVHIAKAPPRVSDEVRHESMPQPPTWTKRQSIPRNMSDSSITPLLKNVSLSDVEKARSIVEKAIAESSRLNQARLLNPMRNNYRPKPGTIIGQTTVERRLDARDDGTVVASLLDISDDMAEAAALVAEADATGMAGNVTLARRATGTYWMESIARKGTVPWGDNATRGVSQRTRLRCGWQWRDG